MFKIKEFIEIFAYSFVVVCLADAITTAVLDTIRLNRIRRLTRESKELINKVKNK